MARFQGKNVPLTWGKQPDMVSYQTQSGLYCLCYQPGSMAKPSLGEWANPHFEIAIRTKGDAVPCQCVTLQDACNTRLQSLCIREGR
jgi:hypothetical protein